jgi:hypothetical protein
LTGIVKLTYSATNFGSFIDGSSEWPGGFSGSAGSRRKNVAEDGIARG